MAYRIGSNGLLDINIGDISITGIVPYINEIPLVTERVSISDDQIDYITADGTVRLMLREEDDMTILSGCIEGFAGAHDIEMIGSAALAGADHVYYQGYGMEGPSGYSPINEEHKLSHGIIGLSGEASALAAFAADHSRYNTLFSAWEQRSIYSTEKRFTASINLECTTSAAALLPDMYFLAGEDVISCMSRAAGIIASSMGARTPGYSDRYEDPAFHWCSWYYHYENLSQSILEGLLSELRDDRVDFNYIQIDAGYTDHIGDWLSFNHRYPAGLKGAADAIINDGYAAGIWIAPYMVGDQSDVYREHPDWVIHEKDGSPYVRFRSYTEPKIWGNTDNEYYVLDITHPQARMYISEVLRTYREYGFTLFKTDFLLWGMVDSSKVIRYDNSQTSVMIMRDLLSLIRTAIGEESYLLGSIAPFMPCIGYMDGMRIASDMGAQWTEGAFGPANLLQELPYDNYFNNIFWQNDPDSVILRDFATHLTDAETYSIALLQAVSGGVITTSDPVGRLKEKRRELLDFIRPAGRVQAGMPYLTEDREEIVITHTLHDWNLLYVLNPTDHPLRAYIRTDELFGDRAVFQYRFDCGDGSAGHEICTIFAETLMPHESALLFITEEPLTARPKHLWSRD